MVAGTGGLRFHAEACEEYSCHVHAPCISTPAGIFLFIGPEPYLHTHPPQPARLEMDVLCALGWRLGPFFASQPDPAFAYSSDGEEEEWDEDGDVDSVPSSGATTWLREAASKPPARR